MDLSKFPMFHHDVTVLHKSSNQHTHLDMWTKAVYKQCSWRQHTERSVSGQTASVAQTTICRIPKRLEPPVEVGDYVILGEIPEVLITPQNIHQIYNQYRYRAIVAKAVSNNTNLVDAESPLRGAFADMEHHRIEGT